MITPLDPCSAASVVMYNVTGKEVVKKVWPSQKDWNVLVLFALGLGGDHFLPSRQRESAMSDWTEGCVYLVGLWKM